MKFPSRYLNGLCIPWLLALAIALCSAVLAVWWGSVNQDEGWYLYAAQLVGEGKLPYRDFFFTQGPALPFIYSALSKIWSPASPLHGLLGGRVVTLGLGILGTLFAMGLVRRLVPAEKRAAAALATFVLLSGNLYHVYFTTIPKTYALGGCFLMAGMLMVARALDATSAWRHPMLAAGGLAIAFASGTRISLLLVLPAVGFTLLFAFRRFRWAFLSFGLGGSVGLFLTYGLFALDPASLKGLLAAQEYHAARGGFDPFFALGAVSRLVRGYAALGAVLFVGILLRKVAIGGGEAEAHALPGKGCVGVVNWMLCLSFAAVFLLQISAPFPYDDYQVPIMGILTVAIVGWFFRREGSSVRQAWFAVMVSGMVTASSPMLQSWMAYGQDRFWSLMKERSELSKLRLMAEEINLLDPGGATLFTQDLYLAVESGRRVPDGMEMGPFSYFPGISGEEAAERHVLNTDMMEKLIDAAPSEVAAFSGYSFAIAAPKCTEVPFERQRDFFRRLKAKYEAVDTVYNFGQNATTLLVLRRKPPKTAKDSQTPRH